MKRTRSRTTELNECFLYSHTNLWLTYIATLFNNFVTKIYVLSFHQVAIISLPNAENYSIQTLLCHTLFFIDAIFLVKSSSKKVCFITPEHEIDINYLK